MNLDTPTETIEAIYKAFDLASKRRRSPLQVVINPAEFSGATYLLDTPICRDAQQRKGHIRLRDEWGLIVEAPLA